MISTSEALEYAASLRAGVRDWVLQGFKPEFGRLQEKFESDARWRALRETGTEAWLDTGDLQGSSKLWTREFSALTTNNTLLNKEVQRGQYDEFVKQTAKHIRQLSPGIPERLLILEVAFVLNAYHGLRLVEHFDAFVSVEEHTDLANDIELAVLYGQRFHEICPQRFIIKLPLTPEGLLATRKLRQSGVPINFTLGFSARHNYLAARIGDPNFVNVFLGRLNAFTSDSALGTGAGVGEKATAASQEAIEELRQAGQIRTRQIAASMRSGEQVWTLAGTDVMTIPLAVAEEYHESALAPPAGRGPRAGEIETDVDARAHGELGFERLWEIPTDFRQAVDALTAQDLDSMTGGQLVEGLRSKGIDDFFPAYSQDDLEHMRTDGKIPKLERWRSRLQQRTVALDALLNASGLLSFTEDQKALDDRVRGLLP